MSDEELAEMITGDVSTVARLLEGQGVKIVRGGWWNVKAPDPVSVYRQAV